LRPSARGARAAGRGAGARPGGGGRGGARRGRSGPELLVSLFGGVSGRALRWMGDCGFG